MCATVECVQPWSVCDRGVCATVECVQPWSVCNRGVCATVVCATDSVQPSACNRQCATAECATADWCKRQCETVKWCNRGVCNRGVVQTTVRNREVVQPTVWRVSGWSQRAKGRPCQQPPFRGWRTCDSAHHTQPRGLLTIMHTTNTVCTLPTLLQRMVVW